MGLTSIVTSTYNRRSSLALALASARGQRNADIEIIVVDNGSTDDTQEFLAGIDDSRIRVIRNDKSLGPVGGRNTGLAAAKGDWVGFLDDDDLWAPDKVAAQLAAAEAAGAAWVYSGCVYIDADNAIIGGRPTPTVTEVLARLPADYVVPGGISGMLFRRTALGGDGLLDPLLRLTTDWDMALRCLRVGPPARVNRPHIAYRQHAHNLSQDANRYREEFALLRHKFADLGVDDRLDLGPQHRFAGSQALRVGERGVAARSYLRGALAGDAGSLARLAAVPLPRRLHPRLRIGLLSDPVWIAAARRWLQPLVADVTV